MIVHEGQLRGSFNGFRNRDTVFEFTDGRKWHQNQYQYEYHYAYMPSARIIQKDGSEHIEVDGMSTTVQVRRVR